MKLFVAGFKADINQESEDHVYFFKATIMGEDLWFELTNAQIAKLTDNHDEVCLPEPFDFGMREPTIIFLLRTLRTMYWKDEDGVLEGCSIEMNKPSSNW